MTSTTVNGTSNNTEDAQKRKQIQQQLILIFHACRCQKLYEINGVNPCLNSHCAMMRNVLNHMSQCKTERMCPFTHCSTSKRIISHWKRCGQISCLICAPIRKSENQSIKTENNSSSSELFSLKLSNGNSLDTSENDEVDDWRNGPAIPEIRKKINQKMLFFILPKLNEQIEHYEDSKVQLILQQIKEFERNAFIHGKSKHDYYSSLSKEIYFLQRQSNPRGLNDLISNHHTPQSNHEGNNQYSNINDGGESDRVKEIHKAIESEYEAQNKLLHESEVKNEPKLEMVKVKSEALASTDIVEKKEPEIKEETSLCSLKSWSTEEIKNAFVDIFNSIKSNKVLYNFLSQTDKTNYSNNNIATILHKYEEQKYTDPWDVMTDINSSIKNGFNISKKSRKSKKETLQIVSELQDNIDAIMKKLGYCCGRDEVYQPLTLECTTSNICPINKDAVYYAYQSDANNPSYTEATYICCEKCFGESLNEVSFITDSSEPFIVRKELLEKKKNNVEIPEEIVTCKTCGRKCHKVCECYLEEIWNEFNCTYCLKPLLTTRKLNRYTAKRLPPCRLSNFLERRVNDYLKKNEIQSEYVIIRVLSNVKKYTEIKPNIKPYYSNMPTEFPYRSKAIFVFQEYKGKEICFFGLHVQEYGSDCPEPNKRRVYIAYLDSVRFFEPAKHRTKVYYEILVGYLDYVKKLGYLYAHIWACPPTEGDDYIFNIHPHDQKVPKPKRLQEWYAKMLNKGIQELVVNDYKDVFKDVQLNNVKLVTEIPYFEGDFWPNEFEVMLKDASDNSKKAIEHDEFSDDYEMNDASNEVGNDQHSSSSSSQKKAKKRKQKKNNHSVGNNSSSSKRRKVNTDNNISSSVDLFRKVSETMEKHRDNFFTIRLYAEHDIPNLPETVDKDSNIESELMDGRENFLQMSRTKHLEFSSLRRALYSTMVMCFELHSESKQTLSFTCNACNDQIDARYHCKVCVEYDLCEACKTKISHEHELEFIKASDSQHGAGSGSDSRAGDGNIEETNRNQIDKLVKVFEHSSGCRDVNCRISNCRVMRSWLQHFKACAVKKNCKICKQIYVLLNIHAKYCQNPNCQITFCQNIKLSMRKNDSRQRMRQKMLIRRRTENMRHNNSVNNASSTNNNNADTPTTPATNNSMVTTTQSPHPYTSNSGPMSNSSITNIAMEQGTPPKVMKQDSYSSMNSAPKTPQQPPPPPQVPTQHVMYNKPQTSFVMDTSSNTVVNSTIQMSQPPHPQYVYSNGIVSTSTNNNNGNSHQTTPQQQMFHPQPSVMCQNNNNNQMSIQHQQQQQQQLQMSNDLKNSSTTDSDSIENYYKLCMTQPEGQLKFNEFVKNNPSVSSVMQMRHQNITSSIQHHAPHRFMNPPNAAGFHGNIRFSGVPPNNVMPPQYSHHIATTNTPSMLQQTQMNGVAHHHHPQPHPHPHHQYHHPGAAAAAPVPSMHPHHAANQHRLMGAQMTRFQGPMDAQAGAPVPNQGSQFINNFASPQQQVYHHRFSSNQQQQHLNHHHHLNGLTHPSHQQQIYHQQKMKPPPFNAFPPNQNNQPNDNPHSFRSSQNNYY